MSILKSALFNSVPYAIEYIIVMNPFYGYYYNVIIVVAQVHMYYSVMCSIQGTLKAITIVSPADRMAPFVFVFLP